MKKHPIKGQYVTPPLGTRCIYSAEFQAGAPKDTPGRIDKVGNELHEDMVFVMFDDPMYPSDWYFLDDLVREDGKPWVKKNARQLFPNANNTSRRSMAGSHYKGTARYKAMEEIQEMLDLLDRMIESGCRVELS